MPVSKNVKMKKKKKKKKKKEKKTKEEERGKEHELHRHGVWSKLPLCFTNGGRDLRTARTDTSLFGGRGPAKAFRRRQENPSERIKPRRRGTHLSCPSVRHCGFYLGTSSFFSNIFGGASSPCDRNVQQTTSGRFQRRARSRPRFGKKKTKNLSTRVLQSLPGVKL